MDHRFTYSKIEVKKPHSTEFPRAQPSFKTEIQNIPVRIRDVFKKSLLVFIVEGHPNSGIITFNRGKWWQSLDNSFLIEPCKEAMDKRKVIEAYLYDPSLSVRKIAKKTKLSIGTVHSTLVNFKAGKLTDEGFEVLEN